mmetsp:Transcript_110943/g.344016  ORF Transcript_110943/g.344016 Transcript_110943/m.344016 type:complete len:128 (-) Transcript_110943:335-718(-)
MTPSLLRSIKVNASTPAGGVGGVIPCGITMLPYAGWLSLGANTAELNVPTYALPPPADDAIDAGNLPLGGAEANGLDKRHGDVAGAGEPKELVPGTVVGMAEAHATSTATPRAGTSGAEAGGVGGVM